MRARGFDWWWDATWNPVGGCLAISPGCTNCYAAQVAGTKTWPYAGSAGVHNGVTVVKNKRRIFNGKVTAAPDFHKSWNMAHLVRSEAPQARSGCAISNFRGR